MNDLLKKTLILVAGGVLAIAGAVSTSLFDTADKLGYVTQAVPSQQSELVTYQFFASSTAPSTVATTTSATSTNISPWFDSNGKRVTGAFNIAGAKDVTVFFKRGDVSGQGNTGSSTFSIDVSDDGSTWYDYNNLRVASTSLAGADAFYTGVGSVVITAATTTDTYKMIDLGWKEMRCVVAEATDGEHTCWAVAEF